MILILMGVSGSGKTTLGTMLAQDTGWPFLDADDFHSSANKAKMAAGHPLTDEDRAPWLAALHKEIEKYAAARQNMVMACSALKQEYRDVLRGELSQSEVRFALLEADPARIADRLQHRQHKYMNPRMLGSQLNTLERPDDAWVVSVEGTPEEAFAELKACLRTSAGH